MSGFTLVELIVAVAVLGIVVGWAIPSMVTLISQNRMTATTNQLVGLVHHARSEALKTAGRVWVSPMTDGEGAASWSLGAVIWVDGNGDGSRAASESVREIWIDHSDITVSGSATSLTVAPFGFDGAGYAIADQAYTLTLCSDAVPARGQRIEINGGGQIRTENEDCGGGA
ncbi:MAG: GspH/FimT family pseudopilin [Marinobacter sp.]|uniref:GspH/FimT family pseudopilin n=1 Tax=Marinobacter sp. TaxID=50741 RepID=UPI00299D32F9|nr:GspH/FimT family pseudopilin [Marinobacter sp.]MDX1756230.1 GspH/FimT family pseudopilin [Marinobacter sp.]